MKIDRNNYEQFMVDYIEGKFNASELRIVEQFISENPDIAEEIEVFKMNVLSDKFIGQLDRKKFYKSFSEIKEINDLNFEEFCIANLENDLDNSSRNRLLYYIGNDPEKKKIYELYQNLKFKADYNIKFLFKHKLKKKGISVYRSTIYYTAIAASILILFMLHNFWADKTHPSIKSQTANSLTKNNNEVVKSIIVSEEMKRRTTLNHLKYNNNPIAVFDTNNPPVQNKVSLATLSPRKINLVNNYSEDNLIISERGFEEFKNNETIIPKEINTTKKSLIPNHSSHERLFLRALRLGVKGINNITESNLVMSTELDKYGNLAEIGLSAGGFEISRKLSSNLQKN
jgi:hypothetical protein